MVSPGRMVGFHNDSQFFEYDINGLFPAGRMIWFIETRLKLTFLSSCMKKPSSVSVDKSKLIGFCVVLIFMLETLNS